MVSRKKVLSISQKQRQVKETASRRTRLPFFNRLVQRHPAKAGGAVISAVIVLHFVSQFFFFQNDNVPDEIAAPKIENAQIAEIKPEYEPEMPDVVKIPERVVSQTIAPPRRKATVLPGTIKKNQRREAKSPRLRPANRAERAIREDEVASLFPYGRFLTR